MSKENISIQSMDQVSMISNIQKKQLEIFKYFDKVCKKYDIEYFLIESTCLDAVTKKGFNPYSILFSIGMTRNNYDLFLEKASLDLKEKYVISNFNSDKKYTLIGSNTKLGLKDTYLKTKSFQTFSHNSFHGIYLSINVLDYTSSNIVVRNILNFLNKLVLNILFLLDLVYINFIPLKKVHVFIVTTLSRHYSRKNKIVFTTNLLKKSTTLPYHDLYPLKKIEFEKVETFIPNNYEIYLKKQFGHYQQASTINKIDKKIVKKLDLNNCNNKTKSFRGFYYTIMLLIISLILFNDFSFSVLGIAILIFGVTLLYHINYPK